MDQHQTDRMTREALEGLEVNPPVDAWLTISESIERQRLKRRVVPVFLRAAASVAALIATVLSLWLLFGPSGPDSNYLGRQTLPVALPPVNTGEGLITAQPLSLVSAPGRSLTGSISFGDPGHGASITEEPASAMSAVMPLNAIPGKLTPAKEIVLLPYNAPDFGSTDHFIPGTETHQQRLLQYFHQKRLERPHMIRLGAHFSPQSNYRILSRSSDPVYQRIPFETLERRLLTFGMGVSGTFRISEAWSFQTGMNYLSMGQYVKDITAYAHPAGIPLYDQSQAAGNIYHPQTIVTSHGSVRMHDPYHYFADVQSYRVITSRQSFGNTEIHTLKKSAEGVSQLFRFVEVPLLFRYGFVRRGIGLQVKGGLSGSYLLQNDVFLGNHYMQHPIGETYGVRAIHFSAVGGLAMEVPLTSRITFHLEPTAQVFLHPVLREGLVINRVLPYSYSLQTGISYGF